MMFLAAFLTVNKKAQVKSLQPPMRNTSDALLIHNI